MELRGGQVGLEKHTKKVKQRTKKIFHHKLIYITEIFICPDSLCPYVGKIKYILASMVNLVRIHFF